MGIFALGMIFGIIISYFFIFKIPPILIEYRNQSCELNEFHKWNYEQDKIDRNCTIASDGCNTLCCNGQFCTTTLMYCNELIFHNTYYPKEFK